MTLRSKPGDPCLADEAAGVGLQLVPGSEAMCRLRMQAAAQRGDDRGIADAFAAAAKAAERAGPWVEISDETAELWEDLGPGRESQAS